METLFFIGIALVVLWIIARVFFRSLGCIIHLALVLAAVLIILYLLRAVFAVF